jgi:hypothetical protein
MNQNCKALGGQVKALQNEILEIKKAQSNSVAKIGDQAPEPGVKVSGLPRRYRVGNTGSDQVTDAAVLVVGQYRTNAPQVNEAVTPVEIGTVEGVTGAVAKTSGIGKAKPKTRKRRSISGTNCPSGTKNIVIGAAIGIGLSWLLGQALMKGYQAGAYSSN